MSLNEAAKSLDMSAKSLCVSKPQTCVRYMMCLCLAQLTTPNPAHVPQRRRQIPRHLRHRDQKGVSENGHSQVALPEAQVAFSNVYSAH